MGIPGDPRSFPPQNGSLIAHFAGRGTPGIGPWHHQGPEPEDGQEGVDRGADPGICSDQSHKALLGCDTLFPLHCGAVGWGVLEHGRALPVRYQPLAGTAPCGSAGERTPSSLSFCPSSACRRGPAARYVARTDGVPVSPGDTALQRGRGQSSPSAAWPPAQECVRAARAGNGGRGGAAIPFKT